MKLIRISSDDKNGIFETQFNQSINVKPMSKIGLNNISANLEPIIYNSSSATVEFKFDTVSTDDDTELEAIILNNSYDRNNYGVLIDAITDGLNNALNYDDGLPKVYLLGSQFRAKIINERTNIECRFAQNLYNFWQKTYSRTSTTVNNNTVSYMKSANASTREYTNGMYSNYPISHGVGYFRAQINLLADDTQATGGINAQGFMIGLTTKILPNFATSSMESTDVNFGIGVSYDGITPTLYSQDGTNFFDFGVQPDYIGIGDAGNTVMEVRKNGNTIELLYTKLNPATTKIEIVLERVFDYTSSEPLYPFIVFHSNELYTKASFIETTLDPYTTGQENSTRRNVRRPSTPKTFRVPAGTTKITQKTLDFSDISLANFLGYEKDEYKQPEDGYSRDYVNFISENLFYPSISARNYILELITNNIDSYDSSQKQRRNIISSVISSDEYDIIQNEPNIIFLDMSNKNEMDMRNITLRLVDTEYNPIKLTGKSVITLLIADEKERSF